MNNTEESRLNNDIFKKIVWRSCLAISARLEQNTTWSLTGVAATVALLISNLDSLSKLVSLNGIKTALVLLPLSLLAALISREVGIAVINSLETVKNLESYLLPENGEQLKSGVTISPSQLAREIAEPFLWPMSFIVRKAGERGAIDHLATDKRVIRLFCVQVYSNMFHGLFAIGAFLAIALSIHKA